MVFTEKNENKDRTMRLFLSLIALLTSFSLFGQTTFVFVTFVSNGNIIAVNASTQAIVNTIAGSVNDQTVVVASGGSVGGIAHNNAFLFNPTQSTSPRSVTFSNGSSFPGGNFAITGDGKTAYSVDTTSGGFVYQINTSTAIATATSQFAFEAIAVSDDGSILCVEGATLGTLQLFFPATNTSVPVTNADGSMFDDEFSFCMTPDGKTVYAIGLTGVVPFSSLYVIDTSTAKVVGQITVPDGVFPGVALTRCAVSADGSILCATDINSHVWIIETNQSSPPRMVAGTFEKKVGYTGMSTIAVSPDGQTAYAFEGSDLFAIDTASATPSLIHNFGTAIASLSIFTIDIPTTTTVSSSPNPSTFGESVTLTAHVTSAGGTPTGTVTFSIGTETLCTATLSGGMASCSTTAIPTGTQTITAAYSGNANFLPSTGTTTQTVNQASTTTTVSSSPNPSTFGESVTLTAHVTSAGGTPTGSVTFSIGAETLCTAPLSGGVASCSSTSIPVGTQTITAAYSGDANFLPSSGTTTQTVNQASTATTVSSSPNPSTYGESVTLTAHVTSAGGTPTGSVTFSIGTETLCTAPLSGGMASCSTTNIPVGTQTITAAYSGDANFLPSSGTTTQTVNKVSTTTTVSSSPNPSIYGQSVTFTAHVTSTEGTPTGTVTLVIDGVPFATANLVNGSASFQTSTLSPGEHEIVAVYSGDAIHEGSTSSPIIQQVIGINPPANFTGVRRENRFATQKDIINELTWHRPSSGATAVEYRIYRDSKLTKLIAVIPDHHLNAKGHFKYKDHRKKEHSYTYYIVSVDEFGKFSKAAYVTIPRS